MNDPKKSETEQTTAHTTEAKQDADADGAVEEKALDDIAGGGFYAVTPPPVGFPPTG